MDGLTESFILALRLLTSLDPGLVEIVVRSLLVSLAATLAACLIGMTLGSTLGVSRSSLKPMAMLFLNTYVAIPAVVVGLIVYIALSRSGPLGFLGWLFSIKAMIFAQTLLVIPLAASMTQQIVADSHQHLGDSLKSMGAGPLSRATLLLINERHALFTVLVTCFGRAVSEVGTVMIVGGNIEGFTRVMTTAIALETSKGDLPLAIGLGIVLLLTVLSLNALLAMLPNIKGKETQR
jgi:tungstate transport system permease protein